MEVDQVPGSGVRSAAHRPLTGQAESLARRGGARISRPVWIYARLRVVLATETTLRHSASMRRLGCGITRGAFSTISVLGAPLDVTLEEVAIESFFPADDTTAAYLRKRFG